MTRVIYSSPSSADSAKDESTEKRQYSPLMAFRVHALTYLAAYVRRSSSTRLSLDDEMTSERVRLMASAHARPTPKPSRSAAFTCRVSDWVAAAEPSNGVKVMAGSCRRTKAATPRHRHRRLFHFILGVYVYACSALAPMGCSGVALPAAIPRRKAVSATSENLPNATPSVNDEAPADQRRPVRTGSDRPKSHAPGLWYGKWPKLG